jgi:hypothetical protein
MAQFGKSTLSAWRNDEVSSWLVPRSSSEIPVKQTLKTQYVTLGLANVAYKRRR